MIVSDSMMFVYLATGGPQQALCLAVLRRDRVWAAPVLWRSEFRNAALGMIRSGGLSEHRAVAAYRRSAAAVEGREYEVESRRVFQAASSRLTAYDLEFVVLAQTLGVPLVTFDRQVLAAFPGVAVHPSEFVAG